MLSYCSTCRKNTVSENPKVARTKKGNERIMLSSKCAACDSKILNLSTSKKLVDY